MITQVERILPRVQVGTFVLEIAQFLIQKRLESTGKVSSGSTDHF